jgi:hypothetical protein
MKYPKPGNWIIGLLIYIGNARQLSEILKVQVSHGAGWMIFRAEMSSGSDFGRRDTIGVSRKSQ